MTFNVPAGTEAGVAVVREDATPGEMARAGQEMMDLALTAVLSALDEDDLPDDVCLLDAAGDEVALVIDDPEPNRLSYYRGMVARKIDVLHRLGIRQVSVRASLGWAIVQPNEPR